MHRIIPNTITAGISFGAIAWRSACSGADWTMTLILRGPQVVDVPSERNGARHVWNVSAATTSGWLAGEYAYAVRAANDDGEVIEVEIGTVRVLPNLAAVTEPGFDGRSDSRKALDAIEAVIAKRATLDQERYRINNRELYRTSIEDLLKLRAHYLRLVAREEGKATGRSSWRQVRVVMGPVR